MCPCSKHKGRRSDSQDTMVAGPSLPPGMTKTKKRSSKKKHRTRSSRSKSERRTSSPSSDSDVSSKHKVQLTFTRSAFIHVWFVVEQEKFT